MANSKLKCHNPKELKFITRLRLALSRLKEHKFKHSFQNIINPLCSYGLDIGSTEQFLLRCSQFLNESSTLLSTVANSNYKLLYSVLTQTLFLDMRHLT